MALDGLEEALKTFFPKLSRKTVPGIHLIRYADDFIITSNSKESLENEVKVLLNSFLLERGLELSNEKTKITNIEEGFNFLGQNIRKYKGKLLIKPSKQSMLSVLNKIRKIIKANKNMKPADLIMHLNPIIRGWAYYHRHVVSSKTFSALDTMIFQTIWRWCKRRHPNKSINWIKMKYFGFFKERNWVFQGKYKDKLGVLKINNIFMAASVPIKRHFKIKGEANPYDSTWKDYFTNRSKYYIANHTAAL